MSPQLLKLLLEGQYICPYRFSAEYAQLCDTAEREAVEDWLKPLKMRLSRLSEEGAFFVSNDFLGPKQITQVKGELLMFRDVYGPAVLLLDFIRQAKGGSALLSPGEVISLWELEGEVSQSTTLEAQLKQFVNVIHNAALRNTNHENLRRLMDHLVKDGYLMLASKETGAYRVTGKIEQLYAVLNYLDENKVIPDTEVDDRDEVEDDLVDQAGAAPEPQL